MVSLGLRIVGLSWCVLAAALTGACGVKDLPLTYSDNAQGAAGSGGQSSSADGGNDSGGEPSAIVTCRRGEMRCAGGVPQTCNGSGEWDSGAECPRTQVCTGAGVCARVRLVNAGIDGLGLRPAEKKLILKEQTLSSAARHCGKSDICVTGGIK
jgi:hypothetical protein